MYIFDLFSHKKYFKIINFNRTKNTTVYIKFALKFAVKTWLIYACTKCTSMCIVHTCSPIQMHAFM